MDNHKLRFTVSGSTSVNTSDGDYLMFVSGNINDWTHDDWQWTVDHFIDLIAGNYYYNTVSIMNNTTLDALDAKYGKDHNEDIKQYVRDIFPYKLKYVDAPRKDHLPDISELLLDIFLYIILILYWDRSQKFGKLSIIIFTLVSINRICTEDYRDSPRLLV